MISVPLNQNMEICGDAIKSSSAKLGETFESLLLEILFLYMATKKDKSHSDGALRHPLRANLHDEFQPHAS